MYTYVRARVTKNIYTVMAYIYIYMSYIPGYALVWKHANEQLYVCPLEDSCILGSADPDLQP